MRYIIVLMGLCFLLEIECFGNNIIPPGTVLLDKKTGTYIDNAEITLSSWLEYLYWLKKYKGEKSEEYLSALPDSATCEKLYGAVRYFQHPKYRNYPVVGISHEQATAYCQWRSDRVNEILKKQSVVYSLPDEFDYQLAFKKQKPPKNPSQTINPINPKKKKLNGIGNNVNELTANPNVIVVGTEGNQLIFDDYKGIHYQLGFRCKAILKNN